MKLLGTTYIAEFSDKINNFKSIKNTINNDEYIKIEPKVPLITLYALKNGCMDKLELNPDQCLISGDQREQIIKYETYGGYNIKVAITLKAMEDSIIISSDITNNERDLEIIEIVCPHISGIYLGDSYEDDVIIYPHHAGERTVNPIREYCTEKYQGFWRAGSVCFGDLYRREINYCGLASMSWMYYYDNKSGLYIGSHDDRYPVTGVIAESGTINKPYMGFGFRKHYRIKTGETYNTKEYKIVISDKDWHYGSEIYRSYISKKLNFDHTPDFLKDEYALNQCYNFKRSGVIENYFKDIPKLYEEGKDWGVLHMFIASWNRTGFDSFYPEYYPDMELGSAMEFNRGLKYIRENGGFSTLYINARIFDLKSDFHKLVGEKMAIKNHRGEMVYESYGPENFTVNCPSDKLWGDYLIDTAEFAAKAYGTDGIYLDQLASAEPFACHRRDHSHENIGEFNNGYLYVLQELLKRLKENNPNAYIMTENCGDIYGSYTWGNLTWNGADYDEYYNLFKYTFPEFVQVNMVNPRGWENDEGKKYRWFFRDMQRAILLGNVLWMGITTRMTPASGEYHTYAKKALYFRKKLQPFLKEAEFKDDKYIVSIEGDCDATCWKLKDGYMILCGNQSLYDNVVVELKLPKACSKKTFYDIDWNMKIEEINSCNVRINLSKERLACVIVK